MAFVRAKDLIPKTTETPQAPARTGGFVRASDLLGPKPAVTTPLPAPVAIQPAPAPSQRIAAPTLAPISTITRPEPTLPAISLPQPTARGPVAPALALPTIAPTTPKVSFTRPTRKQTFAGLGGFEVPRFTTAQKEAGTASRLAEREVETQRKEQLRQREQALQTELGELQKGIGFRTAPETVQRQQELQAELQDVSARVSPGLLGVAEGLSRQLPIPSTFTDVQQKRREVFGFEPSAGIEEAKDTGAFKVASGVTQLAGNVILYQGINQALQGLGTASKLGKLLGGSKLAGFTGTQIADLAVDTIAQAPREFMEAVEEDKTLGQTAKDFLVSRAIDAGINLVIGGVSNRKQVGEWLGTFKKSQIDEAAERVAKDLNMDPGEVRGIASGLLPTEEQLAKRQFGETIEGVALKDVDELGELAIRNNVLPDAPKVQKAVSTKNKDILKGAPQDYDSFLSTTIPKLKSKVGYRYYTTDLFRNFEDTFGKGSAPYKRVIEPFLAAKKANVLEEQQLITSLKENVVDKLGINKNTKLSAAVQKFGEKRMSLEELQKEFPKDWQKVVEGEQYFRKTYDRLLDEVNAVRVAQGGPDKAIPKRKDYFRHFNDMSESFAGLKNLFETPANIDPQMAGLSEFVKPNSKWLAFAQKRGFGKFKDDAVGGMLEYIPSATYAKHIDPQVKAMRGFTKDLQNNTTGDFNSFITYFDKFTNDLAGKTSTFDRPFIDLFGRKGVKIYKALNGRAKANSVMGNLSSAVSQLGNVPNAIATIKNPVALAKGMYNTMAAAANGGHKDLYKQSGFLQERYADKLIRSFDKRIIDQPKKLAAWLLEAGDEVASKFIWSSAYEDALKRGVPNPIAVADDLTRKMVAGRGIGEVPLAQKTLLMQTFAPFTIEVGNALKVQKDLLKNKDLGGFAMLLVANNVFNGITEKITGNRILFDPIQVVSETIEDPEATFASGSGRLLGELLSNTPLGNQLSGFYPEFGVEKLDFLPTRAELFGENDPTRFGTGPFVASILRDPIKYGLLPWGGGQVSKTIKAAKSFGDLPTEGIISGAKKLITGEELETVPTPGLFSKDFQKLKTPIDLTPLTRAKGLAFGTSAIPEVREFYDENLRQMSEKQTGSFVNLTEKQGLDPQKLFELIQEVREKDATTKKARQKILEEQDFTRKEERLILTEFYNYK